MHLPNNQAAELNRLVTTCRGLTETFLVGLAPLDAPIELEASRDLFAARPSTHLLLITEGHVDCGIDGKVVTRFEAGDLLGLPRSLGLQDGIFSSASPVNLTVYERDDLITHINGNAQLLKNWTYYLVCQISFYQQALGQELRAEFQPTTGFMHVQQGDTIIEQGARADQVYTLLEGHAEAFCNGVKVGDINAGEIFGALAVFTRQERMATVTATRDSTLLAVSKEEFIELINHQPHICVGLIEEMAAKIEQLNNNLSTLSGEGSLGKR
jgi:CRP/FNR family cyclic AMP-dependent transcriptional regulator